jgi:hypothetical protein
MTRWRALAFFLLFSYSLASSTPSFENTAIVRSIDLGGTLVHVSTTYGIKALHDRATTYTIALGADEFAKTSWLEVKTKGPGQVLEVEGRGLDEDRLVPFFPSLSVCMLKLLQRLVSIRRYTTTAFEDECYFESSPGDCADARDVAMARVCRAERASDSEIPARLDGSQPV